MRDYIWHCIDKEGKVYESLEALENSNLEIAKSNKLIADAINNVAEALKNKQEHSCEQDMASVVKILGKELLSENIGSFQDRTHKQSYDINSPQC